MKLYFWGQGNGPAELKADLSNPKSHARVIRASKKGNLHASEAPTSK
jgi:hypothetical protein